MGFIGKLFSSVSAIVLLLSSASSASVNKLAQKGEQVKPQPGVSGGAAELFAEFVVETGAGYTEDVVEAAVRRMFDDMSSDSVADLPEFVRNLRSLGLNPEVEVAAVETLISMVKDKSGSLISEEQAAQVVEQILDEYLKFERLASHGGAHLILRDEDSDGFGGGVDSDGFGGGLDSDGFRD